MNIEQVRDFLEDQIQALSGDPDAWIETTETSSTTIFSIHVEPDDRGKIIGRGGNIFEALKRIYTAMGAACNRSVCLEIVE